MENLEYFLYSLKQEYFLTTNWYFSIMSVNPQDTDLVRVNNKKYEVLVDGEWVTITNKTTDEPLLRYNEKITLTKEDISNIEKDIKLETTVGRAIANKILLANTFVDKIPFINKMFDVSTIEKQLPQLIYSDAITIQQYLKFVDACSFIQALSNLFVVSVTYKAITPPPGIEKKKKELMEKMDKEHGKEWRTNTVKIAGFIDELQKVDKEYLKDDPSRGKTLTGKIQNNARVKQYVAFGTEANFGDVNLVEDSLDEGYPKDKDKLTTIMNNIRSGSFSRGHETQKGGAVAKDLLRSATSVNIRNGDCGSNMFKTVLVDESNKKSLKGTFYLNESNKLTKLENPDVLVGKEIKIRSPLFCKEKGKNFCTTCCGSMLENRPTYTGLQLTRISAEILTIALKSMHDSTIKQVETNIFELLK